MTPSAQIIDWCGWGWPGGGGGHGTLGMTSYPERGHFVGIWKVGQQNTSFLLHCDCGCGVVFLQLSSGHAFAWRLPLSGATNDVLFPLPQKSQKCKEKEIKLCGALVAAGLIAVNSSKHLADNQRENYAAITLVDCRKILDPPLHDHSLGKTLSAYPAHNEMGQVFRLLFEFLELFGQQVAMRSTFLKPHGLDLPGTYLLMKAILETAGFYHSAVLNTHHICKGQEGVWDAAKRCYTAFSNSKNSNKHFTDIGDLNFLMFKAIENPGLTPSASLRTSLISVFEDPVIDDSGESLREVGLEDYIGCASAHGVGPSIAIFDTIRDGRLDCACVYPSPLHSRKQVQGLIDHMKQILTGGER
ncbi:hypothetical protein ACLOJK_005838 [Asimina triloba]